MSRRRGRRSGHRRHRRSPHSAGSARRLSRVSGPVRRSPRPLRGSARLSAASRAGWSVSCGKRIRRSLRTPGSSKRRSSRMSSHRTRSRQPRHGSARHRQEAPLPRSRLQGHHALFSTRRRGRAATLLSSNEQSDDSKDPAVHYPGPFKRLFSSSPIRLS